jgi:hypothetical protein
MERGICLAWRTTAFVIVFMFSKRDWQRAAAFVIVFVFSGCDGQCFRSVLAPLYSKFCLVV